jgi:capsular polysaccharide biosynthesis protein
MNSSPEVEAQYEELTRDLTTEQATYNKLLQQSDQSGMATELENRQEGESFTVLDAASLPIDPTFPKLSVFVFGGVVGGIALGLAIVGLLEYRDTALRSERDVWAFTQLPTLAVIAYSTDVAQNQTAPGLWKRIFKRKTPQPQLAG